jgi:dienelactone hydrolase
VLASFVGPAAAAAPTVSVSPPLTAADQWVRIQVRGLSPRERVSISVRSTDTKGRSWRAAASYRASAAGRVVADGGWLVASMTTTRPDATPEYAWGDTARLRFDVTVTARGRTLGRTTFQRAWHLDRVVTRSETVATAGFDGVYYAPRRAAHNPAVLVFGGSEGGQYSTRSLADRFAANGFPALSLAYFKAPGLAQELKDIPLEYFRRALVWLERQPQADAARTAVLGISRGSEAALLLGVNYPRLVHGVFALVPSSVVNCGIPDATAPRCIGAAWTLDGRPVPYTKEFNDTRPTDVPAAVIPVERIKAPVFLACGGVDTIWASCPFSHAIAARLKSRHELHAYRFGGHFLGGLLPYEPGFVAIDLSGKDDERAREDLWPRALAFLGSL